MYADVAVNKSHDIKLVNAMKGNEVDKPFDVMCALILEVDVVENEITVAPKRDVCERESQK